MQIVYALLQVVLILILFVIYITLSIAVFQALSAVLKVFKSRKKYAVLASRYAFSIHLNRALLNRKYIFPVEFVKWVVYDIFFGRVKKRLFGIWCFTGYFGQGKTLGCVNYALKIRRDFLKIGKYVHIYTNFNMKGQDGRIEKWEDLLNLPRCTIVIFDEIQSTFTSQQFKDFPIELLWKITQCRKMELMILASSPVFHRMSIQLRENTDMVVVCNNVLNSDRWFNYKFYRAPEYERWESSPVRLLMACQRSMNFIPSNRDFSSYDTTQIVKRLDITGEETSKKAKISLSDLKAVENNLRKFVEQEIRRVAEK